MFGWLDGQLFDLEGPVAAVAVVLDSADAALFVQVSAVGAVADRIEVVRRPNFLQNLPLAG